MKELKELLDEPEKSYHLQSVYFPMALAKELNAFCDITARSFSAAVVLLILEALFYRSRDNNSHSVCADAERLSSILRKSPNKEFIECLREFYDSDSTDSGAGKGSKE